MTQLRPVFARRLFPCLDEPPYKACFSLKVWRLPQYTARSNMPLVQTSATRYINILYQKREREREWETDKNWQKLTPSLFEMEISWNITTEESSFIFYEPFSMVLQYCSFVNKFFCQYFLQLLYKCKPSYYFSAVDFIRGYH